MGHVDMVHLSPVVTSFAHPVDAAAHPSYPTGSYRWAVHVGGQPPGELAHCVQAGIEASLTHAAWRGEMVAAAAVKALRALGIPAAFASLLLDHDPIPAGVENVSYLAAGDAPQ